MIFYEHRAEEAYMGVICDHPFPSHVHDATEIVYLTADSATMSIADKRYQLFPGDLAIAFPNIPHSYDEISEDAEGICMIFAPDTIAEFSQTFRTAIPESPFLAPAAQAAGLRGITRQIQGLSSDELAPLKLGYLHIFLCYLFTCLPLLPLEKRAQSALTYQALQYISEHFTEPISLESAAHALGISRIHLSHLFSQQLHINFRHYINTLRIDRACTLLQDPSYSISQVAYQCGYGNPRTFHRAFIAQFGVPPNQYRSQLTQRKNMLMSFSPKDNKPPEFSANV
ncbi:MAG: helix-turn-helix domain-containing protein [Clostridia bacterium]|nr:helix-turn-helix domain-containing protein [Clostridia bacterium]